MFPEMADNLAVSISNDLTCNLKSANCYVIHNKTGSPSYVAEKEVQTEAADEAMAKPELVDYVLTHRSEVLTLLGFSDENLKPCNLSPAISPSGSTNSVKFKFDSEVMQASPGTGILSKRRILKRQNKSVDPDGYLEPELSNQKEIRSHSLYGSLSELSPASAKKRNFFQRGKQKSIDMNSTLQKFHARFSSKKSSSIDEPQSPKFNLTVPKIIFNSPEEEKDATGGLLDGQYDSSIQTSPLTTQDSEEMMMGKDNHVLSISMENL